jgi:hypothetical protein
MGQRLPRRDDQTRPNCWPTKDGGKLGCKTGATPTIRTGKPVVEIVDVIEIDEGK